MKMVMTGRIALILAGFGLAASSAAAQQASEPGTELKALAACDARKFETLVIVDGSRGKTVKVCGKPGQTDAEWLVTLRDSANKVKADKAMAQTVKDQILAALEAEIGRLEEAAAATAPAASVATIAINERPVSTPEAPPQYSSVPQLPVPKPRLSASQAKASEAKASQANAQSAPPIRPRLTLRCAMPRESYVACARFERETQLIIRADEDIAVGTSLRFLRGGDNRAELDLSKLRKGDLLREKLPGRVCSGVLRGKVLVQVLSKGQVAETLGPYALHCGS